SSTRFVRQAGDDAYVVNLAALWAADPTRAALIEARPDADPFVYATEPSKAGAPTVVVAVPGGRPIYLHSRHQPLDEAKRLIADLDLNDKGVFYVHGLGLGYHLEALAELASDEAILCVFEPDKTLVRTALAHRDFCRLFESGRLLFFSELDKAD